MHPASAVSSIPALSDVLPALVAGRHLTRQQASAMVDAMLEAATPDAQIAATLALLVAKGETAEELAGFADALYRRVRAIQIPTDVLDTAGTGASLAKTFNVSSAASLVIAAAGCKIAKHGGRASTSRSGSADVFPALGVRIDCPPATAERCLRELGICFLFAPLYHPAMARVAPIRRALGFRTSFNLAGPMVSPRRAEYRLLGVSDQARQRDVAGGLAHIGVTRAWVLRGEDGLDEVTTAAPTRVLEVSNGRITELTISPRDFGLEMQPTEASRASTIEENAATVRNVLSGQRRDVARALVILNAAAAIHVRTGEPLMECAARAQQAIDTGAAMAKLEALIVLSQLDEAAAQAKAEA